MKAVTLNGRLARLRQFCRSEGRTDNNDMKKRLTTLMALASLTALAEITEFRDGMPFAREGFGVRPCATDARDVRVGA